MTWPDRAYIVPIMPTTATTGHRYRRTANTQLIGLRVNAGWSREDMAHEIGIGKETIRLAETGFVPTPRVQFAIARAFKLLPLDIWPLKDQRQPTRRVR